MVCFTNYLRIFEESKTRGQFSIEYNSSQTDKAQGLIFLKIGLFLNGHNLHFIYLLNTTHSWCSNYMWTIVLQKWEDNH